MHPMILSFVFMPWLILFKYVLFIDTKTKVLLVYTITTMVVYCVRMALVFPNRYNGVL